MFSLEVCERLKGQLHELLNKDCNLGPDENEFLHYVSTLDNPKTSLDLVKSWKEEGNSCYSHGDINDALECYGFASVMLSLIFLEEKDATSFCELAFYILLNLAACFLKINEFDQVGLLCSIVLSFDPCNVKALFRRARASVGIGRYDLAHWDLLQASKIDPSNKEIAKKLNEVHSLFIKQKDHPVGLGVDPLTTRKKMKGKHQEEDECSTKVKEGVNSEIQNLLQESVVKDQVVCEEKDVKIECINESVSDSKIRNPNQAEPKYRFVNRRRPGSSLQLSKNITQLLREGKSVQLYNPKSGSYVVVRIAHLSKGGASKKITMQDGQLQQHCSNQMNEHSHPNIGDEDINPNLAHHESEDLLMKSMEPKSNSDIEMEIAASGLQMAQSSSFVSSGFPIKGCIALDSKETKGRKKRNKA
ncbi:uncharacterized protein LOC125497939 [Beta vulgaris subsp. vulgaris]|uniref:uncharacterized protein LOC125497939 n=1 Tax=Beta vulgaris subsp. vulgaris TaxID=3555 RepID=UPI0020368FF6|nr:uncharacterized protein LOC125497939 [Beta vulgaris subsp. vulgaris]